MNANTSIKSAAEAEIERLGGAAQVCAVVGKSRDALRKSLSRTGVMPGAWYWPLERACVERGLAAPDRAAFNIGGPA